MIRVDQNPFEPSTNTESEALLMTKMWFMVIAFFLLAVVFLCNVDYLYYRLGYGRKMNSGLYLRVAFFFLKSLFSYTFWIVWVVGIRLPQHGSSLCQTFFFRNFNQMC